MNQLEFSRLPHLTQAVPVISVLKAIKRPHVL